MDSHLNMDKPTQITGGDLSEFENGEPSFDLFIESPILRSVQMYDTLGDGKEFVDRPTLHPVSQVNNKDYKLQILFIFLS